MLTRRLCCAVAALLVCTGGEELPKEDWVKGAVVVGVSLEGSCIFKPFVKVGDAENDPDTDEPQIIGYSPGDVQIDKQGRVVWERVHEYAFVPLGRAKNVRGRLCKCPPYTM